jgi:putative ABC transport system permease protein
MPLTIRLAHGNVRRSIGDYAVYFATLAFGAALLYSFTSAGTFLETLDLTDLQRSVLTADSLNTILQVFSLLVVIIFASIVVSANRFLVRRRKREFALYGLLGMRAGQVSRILALECLMVGAVSLAVGIAAGVLLSPVFGLITASVFEVPWRFVLVVSPSALGWTVGCFVGMTVLSTIVNVVDIRRRPLLDLVNADKAGERDHVAGPVRTTLTLLVGLACVGAVWFVCTALPDAFFMAILPICLLAYFGTKAVMRAGASVTGAALRKSRTIYLHGLRCFVSRQLESRVVSSCSTLTSVCVLVALGVCLVAGGFAFVAGAHGQVDFSMLGDPTVTAEQAAEDIANLRQMLALFAFISLFYGVTFMVSAAAMLALQQLSQTEDSHASYLMLDEIGCDRHMLAGAVRRQVGAYFAVPLAMALVHDVFGMQFVAYLTGAFGVSGAVPVMPVVLLTVAVMGAYYLITCRQCVRGVAAACAAGR